MNRIVFATFSDRGNREYNEDSLAFLCDGATGFFVLADGLGGHGRGEVASKIAVEKSAETHFSGGGLDECFLSAQNSIIDEQRKAGAFDEMKTTLCLLCIYNDKAQWGHVGDSRIYHFRDGRLIARTMDHSVPQMLVLSGEIKEKAIRNHPDRNRLLRVLGVEWETPRYELADETSVAAGDSFLLCSDGFWELIVEKQMMRCLKQSATPEQWLSQMEAAVLESGAGTNMDNYSAIAVYIR